MEIHNRIIKNLVITGYSGGSGKTYLIKQVIKLLSDMLMFSISTTTRKLRGKEVDGIDYHFVSIFKFLRMIWSNEFLEYNRPRGLRFYGTTHKEYERIRKADGAIAFDVDCKGAVNLKKELGDSVYIVFLNTRKRTRIRWMIKRGDMSRKEIKQRIEFSENIEKPFFEANLDMFDVVIGNYNEDIFLPDLINKIANDLL